MKYSIKVWFFTVIVVSPYFILILGLIINSANGTQFLDLI
jgi:hypothetical protein